MNDTNRDAALVLFRDHNKDPFHLRHALTMEGVMRYFADTQSEDANADFWANVGLLHDIDFEEFPEEHCAKAVEILRGGGFSDAFIHAVCSHGYGLCPSSPKPESQMEKILFAADELSGLIWSCSLVRPSRSVMDLELKSVKKKFKTPAFAAGCNRDVITQGAEMLGWDLDKLIDETILAMRSCEEEINRELR